MNTVGHLQSKGGPKGVTLTLHATHCGHTSMTVRKMKFISYIIFGILSINKSQLKMKQFKIIIDLEVSPALFVY